MDIVSYPSVFPSFLSQSALLRLLGTDFDSFMPGLFALLRHEGLRECFFALSTAFSSFVTLQLHPELVAVAHRLQQQNIDK